MKIPYGKQSISNKDISVVKKTLQSNFLTQGPKVKFFENSIAKFVGSKHVVAVNSATSALHIACLSIGLKKDDYLWTSANSFVASSNCALYCGAKIDFIDIDIKTYNICHKKLEKKLEYAKKKRILPKVIVVVHICGFSAPMKEIYKLSKKYKFKIIEDASHAIGGLYFKNKIGSCKFSDITVFSFHPVKIITTAEGGAAITNSSKIASNLRLYADHGVARNKNKSKFKGKELWNFDQIKLGYNYRMNEIQAALGLSQLKKINSFLRIRNTIANRYNRELKNLPIILPNMDSNIYSSFHLYVILVKNTREHKKLFNYLIMKKIIVNLHYIPIYRHSFYKSLGFKKGYCPSAEDYYSRAISLPIYPNIKNTEQKYVINCIKDYFK